VPWRVLRGHRDLRLLLGAGLVSMTGDWLLGIGVTYSVYAITGSTVASAVTLVASFVPQVAVGLVAGVFVDRWDRRRTMVVTNLLLTVGLLPLVLVDVADHLWVVYVVLAWEATVEVFFAPAEQALLPRLVDDEHLVTANALNSQNQQLSRLVGSALGGVGAAVGGVAAVAALDAVTFVVATLLLLRIRTPGRIPSGLQEPQDSGQPVGAVLGRLAQLRLEWVDGLHAAWGSPVVRVLLVFTVVTWTGEGIMATLFAPYVRDVLHGGPEVLGMITSVQAVGGVLGGLLVAGTAHRWSPALMLGAGAVVFGLLDLAIFLYPLLVVSPYPAVVGMVLVGLPGALVTAGMMTLYQRHTADARRGRVLSLAYVARSVAALLGTTCAGLLGGVVGILPVLVVQGAGYVAAGLLVLAVLVRGSSPRVADMTDNAPPDPPAVARFRAELTACGGRGEIVVLPESVHTAVLAAEALGCEVGAIANSLLFDADGSPVLILTSGSHRVDTGKAAARLGVSALRRARPDFVREHTGQVIGGVSPIAHPRPVPTYIDPWLRRYDVVWAAAGHPAAVFSSTYEELVAMTGAVEIDVE
jgi:prolyl-tRNA editing enzyme YbaK/EbsC (Cys-tRNA(Pro) deacylase)/Na+/melibiose symporter-like transporter